MAKSAFTLGIEEEYFLVDPKSRDIVGKMPHGFLDECQRQLQQGQVAHEFLQCQVEVATRPHGSIGEARDELTEMRRIVGRASENHGCALMAASTHPFGHWKGVDVTDHERYHRFQKRMQGVVRRMMTGGMHLHVEVKDRDLCIDLMNQTVYILPFLLALSTSSPFWMGSDSGLQSYRLSIWGTMPRSGLPQQFKNYSEYLRHLETLKKLGLLADGSMVWWDVRPNSKYPTLEVRICDVCTDLDDAMCIMALYLSWVHMLTRLKKNNLKWRSYAYTLIEENRWRAQRYGIDEGLVDFGREMLVPFHDLVEEFISFTAEDAHMLGCEADVAHARTDRIATRCLTPSRRATRCSAPEEREGYIPSDSLDRCRDRDLSPQHGDACHQSSCDEPPLASSSETGDNAHGQLHPHPSSAQRGG